MCKPGNGEWQGWGQRKPTGCVKEEVVAVGASKGFQCKRGVARIAFSTACSVELGTEWQLRSGNVQGWSHGTDEHVRHVSGATTHIPPGQGQSSLQPVVLPLLTGALHACSAPGVGDELPGFPGITEGLVDSSPARFCVSRNSYKEPTTFISAIGGKPAWCGVGGGSTSRVAS